MTKTINVYDIETTNLNYSQAIAMKKLFEDYNKSNKDNKKMQVHPKVYIRDKETYKVKCMRYITGFDK